LTEINKILLLCRWLLLEVDRVTKIDKNNKFVIDRTDGVTVIDGTGG